MSKINLTKDQVLKVFAARGVTTHTKANNIAILAVRDADGDGNEFNVYDDCMFVVSKDKFRAFDANTDPVRHSYGIAQLASDQVIKYRPGRHKYASGYAAFRQASNAKINRKGKGIQFDNIGANIHRGGNGNTSSIACQTLHPKVWGDFRAFIYEILGVKVETAKDSPGGFGPTFEYLLMDRTTVEQVLGNAPLPTPPDNPTSAEPYDYVVKGKKLAGVVSMADIGYAPTRATLGAMTGLKPESLVFSFADGDDVDTRPDLIWRSPDGRTFPIDTLDIVSNGKTLGRISHMAVAAGLTWTVDSAKKEVKFE
jgi:hypothetical protein